MEYIEKKIILPCEINRRTISEIIKVTEPMSSKTLAVSKDNRIINMKSTLGLLSLNAYRGDEITIICGDMNRDIAEMNYNAIIKCLNEN